MKIQRIILVVLAIIVFFGLSISQSPAAQAQQAPFLITPYYGTKGINSFFDHEYPTQTTNGSIVIYNGDRRSPASISDCTLGYSCYDGHEGIDFPLNYEPVIAAASGQVNVAGWQNTNCRACQLGLRVEIQHSNGYLTRYGHLSAIAVEPGQWVQAGQIIGTSGNTGASWGAHLHFEVLNSALRRVDPFGWSGGYPDPWAQHAQGATSTCLWKDGQWAQICGGIQRPISAPHSGGEIIVDDTPNNTGGFSKGGGGLFNNACQNNCQSWTAAAAGYGGDRYYTPADRGTGSPDQWARWQPSGLASSSAIYEIFVHVPNVNATTWQAPFVVVHADGTTTTVVDQLGLNNQWVSIGAYRMVSGNYVYTHDATGEAFGQHCSGWCSLGADAVKFVRRGTTYLADVRASGGWLSTVTVRSNGGAARMVISFFNSNGDLRCGLG